MGQGKAGEAVRDRASWEVIRSLEMLPLEWIKKILPIPWLVLERQLQ